MSSTVFRSVRKASELRASIFTQLAQLFAGLAEAERLEEESPTPEASALLTRRAYVARFGSADGWSALETAAARGTITAHRLGRSKAFLEEDAIKIAATREPRKAKPKAIDTDNPRASYLALVNGGGR